MSKISSGEKVREITQEEVGWRELCPDGAGMWLPQVMTDSEAGYHLSGSLV